MPQRFVFVVYDAAAVRGANCTAMPRPPLLGEVSPKATERLYEGEPSLWKRILTAMRRRGCTKGSLTVSPVLYNLSIVNWQVLLAKGR